MTLARTYRCFSYTLVGVVIGYAIASWGEYAFAQNPCLPGQPCVIPPASYKPIKPNPPARLPSRLLEQLQKLNPQAIQQLQREDPQAIEKLRQLDPHTLQRLQQLAPNSRQQLQQYAR
ncbi:hypothetical protein [Iningainema tapete]|uniref:Uncharacterized protein n=1 Tax=Iningainema tapete BLCC-T55 TaxID=2748662 RepID=A0A8J6XJJ2_9CYAN|nr:hypothetical protein [Iningainema tapete]MBD2775688.1 hypothetical protein [Iningainema tapete BLCC-T55]